MTIHDYRHATEKLNEYSREFTEFNNQRFPNLEHRNKVRLVCELMINGLAYLAKKAVKEYLV